MDRDPIHSLTLPAYLAPRFSEQQLNLPLSDGSCEQARSLPGVQDHRPHTVLADYLHAIGADSADQLAEILMREFGTLSRILDASWFRLRRHVGARLATTLLHSRTVMRTALTEGVCQGPLLASRQAIADYLKDQLGGLAHERIVALYCDETLHLIRAERLADGSVRSANLNLGYLIRLGFDAGAAGFLLVHNHPSGDPRPSQTDIRSARRLQSVAAELEMPLIDSLIIAGNQIRSELNDWWDGNSEQFPSPDSAAVGPTERRKSYITSPDRS